MIVAEVQLATPMAWVQNRRIAAARQLINDLAVLHHIVLVAEHQVVGAQSQNIIVLDLQVLFRSRFQVSMWKILHLLHAVLGRVNHLIFSSRYTGLLHILAPILSIFMKRGALLQLAGQNVANLVQLGGLCRSCPK